MEHEKQLEYCKKFESLPNIYLGSMVYAPFPNGETELADNISEAEIIDISFQEETISILLDFGNIYSSVDISDYGKTWCLASDKALSPCFSTLKPQLH